LFFAVAPHLIGGEDVPSNKLFLIPALSIIPSILGFFKARIAGVALLLFGATIYVVLVFLEKGGTSTLFYALGPAWPPIVASCALLWVAKEQATTSVW
jgi:hypothetical protein